MVSVPAADDPALRPLRAAAWGWLAAAIIGVTALLVWQAVSAGGAPDPAAASSPVTAFFDISVLVFREGLECILVFLQDSMVL